MATLVNDHKFTIEIQEIWPIIIWGKTEQILHPKVWKHLDLVFGILYLKKLNCLLMSKHLESNWRTTYFLPNNVNMWRFFIFGAWLVLMFCFCFVLSCFCVCAVYAPALDNGVLDVLLISFHGGFGGMGNVSLFFFLVLLSFVGKFDVVFFLSWVIALFWPLLAFWLFSPLTCLFICFLACFVKTNKDIKI